MIDVSAIQALVREGYNKPTKKDATSMMKGQKKFSVKDVASPSDLWDEANASVHNVSIHRPSHDAWGIKKVVLVFCDDFLRQVYDLPWWQRDDVKEAVRPVLQTLGVDSSRIVRLLLASLPPGVTIPVHHDSGEWVKHTHRVHVPILVNDPCRILFRCGLSPEALERIDCSPGHIFEINNQAKHAVSNCDDDYRVHLILDYVDEGFDLRPRICLQSGELLLQTRRSIDRLVDRGQRPTPSFLILGAQKAGTTSLYEYLVQHPLVIRARRRETHCFDWRWNDKLSTTEKQREWCHKFFFTEELKVRPSCMTGDSTPSYLLDSRRVIPRLLDVFNWPIRFFVMIRDPVKRAESHYAMATSTDGNEAQLKARGSEWRKKALATVVSDELQQMNECNLIPYWNFETMTVDMDKFHDFVGSQAEDEAYGKFLSLVPLNTGSHSLIARGLYELQLRPWFAAFDREAFHILCVEDFKEHGVGSVMNGVWEHLDLPKVDIDDDAPKNTRDYVSLMDDDTHSLLHRFFEPHNARLATLLGRERLWG